MKLMDSCLTLQCRKFHLCGPSRPLFLEFVGRLFKICDFAVFTAENGCVADVVRSTTTLVESRVLISEHYCCLLHLRIVCY